MGGVLAIDFGERTTGLASADALRIALDPLKAVRINGRVEILLAHVAKILEERNVTTLLVGMPFHMGGEAGSRVHAVRLLCQELRGRFPDLEVVTFDERLTTKEAEARLRELGYRSSAISSRKDSWSALVLLEDWVRSGEPRDPSC